MYRQTIRGWKKHLDFMILDALILQLAFSAAYVTRHGLHNPYQNRTYCVSAIIVVVMGMLGSVILENHKSILRRGLVTELRAVLQLMLSVTLAVVSYLFFTHSSHVYSRLVALYFAIYGVVLVLSCREMWKPRLLRMEKPAGSRRHLLVITTRQLAEEALHTIQENSFGQIEIIGVVLTDDALNVGAELCGVKVVSPMKELIERVQQLWVDEVMICLPRGEEIPEEVIREFTVMGITTHLMLDIRSDDTSVQRIEKVAGYTVLTESMRMASSWELSLKRAMDIAGGLVGCLLTGILMLLVAPAIYFADPGPIFFTQERVGRNGRTFKLYKFRSMYQDAEERKQELMKNNNIADGMMFKMDDDPRILGSGKDGKRHGIGWLIRRTSIDEFPQFYNVLRGDISLVGTRPPTVDEWEKYDAHHRARLAFKPGITGLWQVSGRSNITDFEDVVALDLKYINNWSIWEDIWIVLKTVQVVVTGEGAE